MFDAYIIFKKFNCRFIAKDTIKKKFIINYVSFCLNTIFVSRNK